MHFHFTRLFHLIPMNKELKEIYLNLFIVSIALSLINIFIPIYLLENNFSLFQVILFLLIFYFAYAFGILIASKLSNLIGVKHCVALRGPINVFYLIVMFLLPYFPNYLVFVALFFGLISPIHWINFWSFFIKYMDKGHRGEEFSLIRILGQLSGFIGPIIGALIIVFLGFNLLFLIAIIFLLLSVLPLFKSSDYKEKKLKFFDGFFNYKLLKFSFAWFFYAPIALIIVYFIPLYLFFLKFNLIEIGSFYGLIVLSGLFFSFLVGRYAFKFTRLFLVVGSIGLLFSFTLFSFLHSLIELFFVSFFIGFFFVLIDITFNRIYFIKFSENTLKASINRDLFLSFSRIILFLVFILSGFNFQLIFSIAGISLLYFLVVKF